VCLRTQFTNCHLEKSELETYPCTEEMSLAACTRPMADSTNGIAYVAYTHFFTHAESMCFYLQSAAFQAATEQARAVARSSRVPLHVPSHAY
jgi:hypothetical protein